MSIERVDLLIPWKPRHFVVPEDEMIDELCIASLCNKGVLAGYSPTDERDVVLHSTRAIYRGLEKIPLPPNRRLK